MDVFNGDLKAVKKLCLRVLHLRNKMLGKVFVDNSITRSKKCQNMSDEMSFAIVKIGPILQVVAQIDFFGCPETRLCLLVVFPDVVLADREEDETVFVLS